MANLSPSKRAKIHQLIRDHHKAFAVEILGEDAVSHDDFLRLVKDGIIKHGDIEHAQVSLQAAHHVGKMRATVSDAKLSRMTPEQFWAFVDTAPPQFNAQELDSIMAAREKVGQ